MASVTRILSNHLPLVSRTEPRADANGNPIRASRNEGSTSPQSDLSSPDEIQTDSRTDTEMATQATTEPLILPSGPFAGLSLPHLSARANAAHIVRNHVSTYLITHPHLDHIAGFAINTAAFHATSRPKRLAALPFTVDAIKKHIFNDVIWPNLTDEDGGVGFVTFQRLKEGGDVMVGSGEGRGYIEVCEGLSAKGFKISHGRCMRPASISMTKRGSVPGANDSSMGYNVTPRNHDGHHHSYMSISEASHGAYHDSQQHSTPSPTDAGSPVDSTAYFVRDVLTHREVLMFGDVEPDSVAIAPRMARIWAEAAPKIASGVLSGMFVECSYDDSQSDAVLFGHMAPRHLIDELRNLAEMVSEERAFRAAEKASRKRKRAINGTSLSYNMPAGQDMFSLGQKRSRSFAGRPSNSPFRHSSMTLHESGSVFATDGAQHTPSPTPPRATGMTPDLRDLSTSAKSETPASVAMASPAIPVGPPLAGLRVIIIHVKDTLTDGPHVSENILAQLQQRADLLRTSGKELGCTFEISEAGKDYWF